MKSGGSASESCCGIGKKYMAHLPEYAEHLKAVMAIEPAIDAVTQELTAELVAIPGGFFEMGARKSTYPADLDSPRRKIRLSPYHISPIAVTNSQFARFVDATAYRTVAEREGWSFVFHLLLESPSEHPEYPPGLWWWRKVNGASWAAPEGSGSCWRRKADHPVVHVSWFDAIAYCRWAGVRLPSEAEWERAARGGLSNKKFPWGNDTRPAGRHAMNVWQGVFPDHNTAEDGFIGTAPVRTYEPNKFGLYNTSGNVWEWVQDFHGPRPLVSSGVEHDPKGPAESLKRVQRGGSYLCHPSYCDRYHVHSRTGTEPDSTTGNCGFRVAASIAASA